MKIGFQQGDQAFPGGKEWSKLKQLGNMRNLISYIKPLGCGLGVGLFCLQAAAVHGATLAPGGLLYPPPAEADPVGGSVVASISSPWVNSIGSPFFGTLTSTVIAGDTSNPYAGGLTFTYQLFVDVNSSISDPATAFTVGGFSGFTVDASYQVPAGAGVIPDYISRNLSGLGQTIDFDFAHLASANYIAPGLYSAVVVLQTSATTYTHSTGGVSDNNNVSVVTLAPLDATLPVPEPATVSCLVLGLGALAGYRRLAKRGQP